MTDKQPSLFAETPQSPTIPHSKEEWFSLDTAVMQAFTPHGPIDEDALFAGRSGLTLDVIDVVFQKGCHAIIYGERGVGKTSFANILRDKIFSRSSTIKVSKRNCTATHNYKTIWQDIFDDYIIEGRKSTEYITDNTTAYDIYKIFDMLSPSERTVIVIDEFDRVKDTSTFEKMADTIKYLADFGSRATIIIVGVGQNVHDLFGGHPSIHRNIRQIKMPKMDRAELLAILDKRMQILNMSAAEGIVSKIIDLSQGFPGFTHLIAQAAFRAAVARKEMTVSDFDLRSGIQRCVDLADEQIKDAYYKAVRSTKPNHYYKEALTAFALAESNERGYFKAMAIKEPFSAIMGKPMEIPNYARHLKEFQDLERGPVLAREGKPKSYEYRFLDPLLKPFSILYGIKDGIISMADFVPPSTSGR